MYLIASLEIRLAFNEDAYDAHVTALRSPHQRRQADLKSGQRECEKTEK